MLSATAALFALPAIGILFSFLRPRAWQPLVSFLTSLHVPGVKHYSNSPSSFTFPRAFNTYTAYGKLSMADVHSKTNSFRQLRGRQWRIGHELGYPRKIDRLIESISFNSIVTDGIARLAKEDLPTEASFSDPSVTDLGRVREALKHFVRDWSDEGKMERDRIFHPILDVLRLVEEDERVNMNVLVPGAGLGRLAWEISQLGYKTTSNEVSFYMNLAFRFLLSRRATPDTYCHAIQPFAHWWSHQRTNDSLFRKVSFPDTLPMRSSRLVLSEVDFMTLQGPFDFIVTLFFIDTASNLIDYIQHIYRLLRPGGKWINLGPLLYAGTRIELSLDEVLHLAEIVGFEVLKGGVEEQKTVESEYTGDRGAMMRWLYQAEFWVARRN